MPWLIIFAASRTAIPRSGTARRAKLVDGVDNWREGSGDEGRVTRTGSERSQREVALLGARLADAEGYRVVSREGRDVGVVDHVRYEQFADHPDDVVITRRVLLARREGVVPFSAIDTVDRDHGVVYLRIGHREISQARGSAERTK
jgi:hypothetical protein